MSYGVVQAEKMTTESGYSLGAGNASSFKNRIINGGMVIDQRNAGASVTINANQYTLDRWFAVQSQTGKYSVQQNAGSVTPPAGFTNYLGVTSLSAHSVSAGDFFYLRQQIEGYNAADFALGTANASTVTVSFWVRSSLTGTFGASLSNGAYDSVYPFTYTINSANTWEQKTVTVAGRTSGSWNTTNGAGLILNFALATGSNFSGTANAWTSSLILGVTGQTQVLATNGATFYLTGVQLEVGTVATSFDFRSYGTELALCQRYFRLLRDPSANGVITGSGLQISRLSFFAPVQMRATPTIASSGTFSFWNGATTATSTNQVGSFPTVYGDFQLDFGSLSVNLGADGRAGAMFTSTNTTPTISVNAEL